MTAQSYETFLTWLYAPGDRPEVVVKALDSGADVVLIDLEDAVAPDRKTYALDATAELLAEKHPVPVHVRVNALDPPRAESEVRRLTPLPGLGALRLPKVHGPADLDRVSDWSVEVPPCTPSWSRRSASSTRTRSRGIPAYGASRWARRICGRSSA